MTGVLGSEAGIVALIALGVAVLALLGVAVLLVRQQRLAGQYHHFMRGASGANLESVLAAHVTELNALADQMQALDTLAHRLEQEAHDSVRRVSVIRYNPFRDTGGDQSFAIVMADDRGNGAVLSSLHARDVTRVYAKPLEN